MNLFYNLLNNNFLSNNLEILGVFTGTASILGFLIFILRLVSIIICFNHKSNQFIKKVQKYFRVFRILIMLFMLVKFIWTYDLKFYSFCFFTFILLCYALYRYRSAFSANKNKMSMFLFINSETNKITVYPDRNITVRTHFDTVERRFEFNISNEQIQEITTLFGPNVINTSISGQNANQIVETYVMPLIRTSEMHSLFLEILNPF